MRKSTIIGLGIAIVAALPAMAESLSPFKVLKGAYASHKNSSVVNKVSEQGQGHKDYLRVSELASKFRPGVARTYGWTGKKWELDEEVRFTYDASGNEISELSVDADGDYSNVVFEYDSNGMVIFRESKVSYDGVNFENNKKTEFEYDPILTNVITRRTEWLWMDFGKGYDWQLVGNNYKRTITRNDDGNVTSVVISVLFQDIYDPTQRLDITYGEDGKATSITEKVLDYDGKDYFWEKGIQITDIKWENTDGQIYDPENLFLGNNRISSAHYVDEDDMDFNVTVEYADGSEAYKVTMEGFMFEDDMEKFEVEGILVYTPLENGGYISEGTTLHMGEVMYTSKEEVQYDEWGHLLLSYESETEDDETDMESTVGTVEYDENGLPTSYTVSEEYIDNRGKLVSENVFRIEYFDYVDVTAAVERVDVDADAPVCYYNLQGLPIQNPAKGSIVIRKQGTRVDKVKY